jgi:hypothetical protein
MVIITIFMSKVHDLQCIRSSIAPIECINEFVYTIIKQQGAIWTELLFGREMNQMQSARLRPLVLSDNADHISIKHHLSI